MRSVILLWASLALLSGCASNDWTIAVPAPPPVEKGPAKLWVGVARADLTVPPGASTWGHALDSRVAEGYWTRNYCRVFYFVTSTGKQLVIVPCELAAMSSHLRDEVIKVLGNELRPQELMMTAVHTHAGVAHYFGSNQYTGVFSSRLPGYDASLTQFLAGQIARAIAEAGRDKRPAKLSWSHTADFWGYTRNRSIDAYRLNRATARHPRPAGANDREDYRAIDPELHVLGIFEYSTTSGESVGPIGSLSFFAMHPTVIRNSNKLFGADTAGVVSRTIERHLRQQEHATNAVGDPLHGVINTNEGDISPRWTRGNIDEAITVGEAVASFVWEHHPKEAPANDHFEFDTGYVEEKLPGLSFEDHGTWYRLCPDAYLGQGSARGASDHPTSLAPVDFFGRNPPARYDITECQSPKLPLLGAVSRYLSKYPEAIIMAAARIDNALISFVPAELTYTAGYRLNQRVLAAIKPYPNSPKAAIVAGLANQYLQYVATGEEYQLQAYEGASTIYGPTSARYLANRMALLAKSLFDPAAERELEALGLAPGVSHQLEYSFAESVHRLAEPSGEPVERKHLGTCTVAVSEVRPPIICMYWHDAGPGDVPLRATPDSDRWIELVDHEDPANPVQLCQPSLTGVCDPAGFVNDKGLEFRTRIHEEVRGAWVWSTTFSPLKSTWAELNQLVRIRAGRSPNSVRSCPFSNRQLPPLCTTPEARLCQEEAATTEWDVIMDNLRDCASCSLP